MSVFLAPDPVTISSVTPVEDEHGWVAATAEVQVWAGMGSCQETVPAWDGSATDRGGAGPYDPAAQSTCDLYLPEDATVAPGHVAAAHGVRWLVQRVRLATDPTGSSGAAGSLVVSCVQFEEEA